MSHSGFDSPMPLLRRDLVKNPVDWSIGPMRRTTNTTDILQI
jgi:hypothetical protein